MLKTPTKKSRESIKKKINIRKYFVLSMSLSVTLSVTYPVNAQLLVENLHDADGSGVVGDTGDEWGLDIGEVAGVSENGSTVVGTIHDGNLKRPFIWSADNGLLNLADTDSSGVVGDTPSEWGVGAGSALDVSADGNAVVGSVYDTGGKKRAFYWDSQRGMLNIADGNNSGTIGDVPEEWAVGSVGTLLLSPNGTVAGGKITDLEGIDRVFRWTPETRLVNLQEGSTWATGAGDLVKISVDGSVFSGFVHDGTENRAYRWDQATGMINLSDGDGNGVVGNVANEWAVGQSRPVVMSADGSVIGGWARDSDNVMRPWVWRDDLGMINIADKNGDQLYDPLEGEWADSHGRVVTMSDDGTVVAGYALPTGGSNQAYRWTEASGMVNIDGAWAVGHSLTSLMSADGSVIVGRAKADGTVYYPFRWDQTNGMVNLADKDGNGIVDGTSTEWATGSAKPQFMSTDGNIIAGYANDGVSNKAFIWGANTGMTLFGDLDGSGVTGDTDEEWAEAFVISGISNDGSVIAGKAIEKTTQKYRAFVTRGITTDPGTDGLLLDIENTQTSIFQNFQNQLAAYVSIEANLSRLIKSAIKIDNSNEFDNGNGFAAPSLRVSATTNPVNVDAQHSLPWDMRVISGRQGRNEGPNSKLSSLTVVNDLPNGLKIGGLYGFTRLSNKLSSSALNGDLHTVGAFLEIEVPEFKNTAVTLSHARSSSKNVAIARLANLTGTENATGNTTLQAKYYSLGIQKNWQVGGSWVATTTFELSRSHSEIAAYTEQAPDFPITYGEISQHATIARIGIEAHSPVYNSTKIRLNAGIDWDLERSSGSILGKSEILGMQTFSLSAPSVVNKVRVGVGAGVSQTLESGHVVDFDLYVQQNTFSRDYNTVASVGYKWQF